VSDLVERLKAPLKEGLIDVKASRGRRVFVRVRRESFRDAVSHIISGIGVRHLSAITGVDMGGEIELLYHFAYNSVVLTLGVSVPKGSPTMPTVTDLVPGAVFYEREAHEFLGAVFEGHPDLSPLLLPEGWPEGVYPLRKENDYNKLHETELRKV